MGITVLGPLTVDGSGLHSRRDRVVLAVLAAQAGHPVTADQLLDAVWGESAPASAAKNLQGCMVRLRKLLGNEAITTSPHGYALMLLPDQIDAVRFEQLVDRAREVLLLDEPDRAAYLLGESLSLWQGDPFPDLEAWEPAEAQTHRLRELRLDAEELYADARLRSGQHHEALADCQRLIRAAPLRERRWTLLARAQYLVGSQGEALRTLHRLRSMLTQQLGIDPGPEVHELEVAILRQDVSLTADPALATAGATRGTCPWQGLRSHDVGDEEWFFGRERDVAACLEILRESPVLALVGPSGCGTSSLLKAGVASALRARGRRVVVITPNARSLVSLSGLATAPTDDVLVVDQGEELFTLCDEDDRRELLDALARESRRRTVLLALRADRLADLAAHPGISRLVERGLYLVGGLDEAGLRAAIEGPARRAGLFVEPGLVDLLVLEVSQDPGALPLLSHALLETWKRREGRTLTVAGYRASGGIRGAVAKSAERLYAEVDADQRAQLRELMLRLVAPGEQGDPVRMKVPRRVVKRGSALEQLLDRLVASRLVTIDSGMLEITHEALIRSWPRLQGWLHDDVEGQRILHHVAAAAGAWDSMGRPVTELYRGVRLARALDWREKRRASLAGVEDEFLAASLAEAELEAQSAAQRARVQARLIRRLRLVLAGAVVLLVLAVAAGGLAAVQSDRARDNADATRVAEAIAEQAARSALARSAAAHASATQDVGRALALGVAALDLEESPEILSSLMSTLVEQPALIETTPLAGDTAMALDVAPGGDVVAVLDKMHHARLVDLATGEELADRQVGEARNARDESRHIRFSPDGTLLAVESTPLTRRPVRLLDGTTLEPLPRQPGGIPPGDWQVLDLSVSGDSTSLVAVLNRLGSTDAGPEPTGTWVFVWRLDALDRPVRLRQSLAEPWTSAVLSPDGARLYTGWPEVRVRDMATGRVRVLHGGHGPLDISPDGRLLALSSFDGTGVLVLDAVTGAVRHRLPLPGESGLVRFSDDGRRLMASTWHDRDTAVWDVGTGREVARFVIGQGASGAVDLDPTATRLASAGTDNALRRWDVEGRQRYLRRIPVRGLPWGGSGGACLATPSPGGAYVGYSHCDTGEVITLEVAREHAWPGRPAGKAGFAASGSWDPTAGRYVSAVDGKLVEYDADTGRSGRTADPLGGNAVDFHHTPDGSRLVATDGRHRVVLLDAETLDVIGRPVQFDDVVWGVSGPDDHRAFVVTGGPDTSSYWMDASTGWAVVDLETGTVLKEGSADMGVISHLAYAPDGRHAAVAGSEQVLILDLETGEPVRAPGLQAVHDGGARWVAFSADGTQLVSGGYDGSVALWDVETGRPTARVNLDRTVAVSAEFRPDGRVLLVPWWEDPAVYVWDPSPERAVAFACRAAGRALTEQEWVDSFGDEPYRETCPSP